MRKPTFPPGNYGLRDIPSDIRMGLRKIGTPNETKTDVILRALRRGLGLPSVPVIMEDTDAEKGAAQ